MRLVAIIASTLMGISAAIGGPVSDAARNGETEKLKLLLEGEADVNEPGFATPIQMAAMFGRLGAAKLLIEHGADVNRYSSAIGTAAHAAAKGGHTEILTLVLQAEANPDARDSNEYTPLMVAAQFGHAGAVEVLLENDADFSLIAEVNRSVLGGLGKVNALHVAIHNGNLDIAELLIEAGASPKAPASVSELVGAGNVSRGREAALKWCGNCHVIESAEREGPTLARAAGPSLVGVFGRASAIVADYDGYSDSLRQVGWIWDEDNIFAFSNEPALTVPGTSMRYRDGWSEAELADIVAYLKSKAQ